MISSDPFIWSPAAFLLHDERTMSFYVSLIFYPFLTHYITLGLSNECEVGGTQAEQMSFRW